MPRSSIGYATRIGDSRSLRSRGRRAERAPAAQRAGARAAAHAARSPAGLAASRSTCPGPHSRRMAASSCPPHRTVSPPIPPPPPPARTTGPNNFDLSLRNWSKAGAPARTLLGWRARCALNPLHTDHDAPAPPAGVCAPQRTAAAHRADSTASRLRGMRRVARVCPNEPRAASRAPPAAHQARSRIARGQLAEG